MFSIYKEAKVKTTTKIKEIQMNNNDINGQIYTHFKLEPKLIRTLILEIDFFNVIVYHKINKFLTVCR